MAQPNPPIPTSLPPGKHNVHKFQEITPRLDRDNWVSWKWEILVTMRERGLYEITLGQELLPTLANTPIYTLGTIEVTVTGNILLKLLVDEWNDKNNSTYNQLL